MGKKAQGVTSVAPVHCTIVVLQVLCEAATSGPPDSGAGFHQDSRLNPLTEEGADEQSRNVLKVVWLLKGGEKFPLEQPDPGTWPAPHHAGEGSSEMRDSSKKGVGAWGGTREPFERCYVRVSL